MVRENQLSARKTTRSRIKIRLSVLDKKYTVPVLQTIFFLLEGQKMNFSAP